MLPVRSNCTFWLEKQELNRSIYYLDHRSLAALMVAKLIIMEELEIGHIVRRNSHGKARYIVIDAGPQHKPTSEEMSQGYMIADRCKICACYNNQSYKFISSLCDQLLCDGNKRTDKKNVCWAIYSTGRLSREKVIYYGKGNYK